MDEDTTDDKEAFSRNPKIIELHYPDSAELDYLFYKQVVSDPLTFEQFVITNYQDYLDFSKLDEGKLSFVPNINPAAAIGSVIGAGNAIRDVADTVRGARQALKYTVEQVQDLKESLSPGKGGSSIDVSTESGNTGAGSGGSGNDGGPIFTNNGQSYSRMDVSPNPTEVRLNSGLIPNAYSNFYHEATASFSPLSIIQNKIVFNNNGDVNDPFTKYFDNVISLLFQIAAQKGINFNTDSTTNFSAGNLKDYLNIVTSALQYYYFGTSVFAYINNSRNKHDGMFALKNFYSNDDVDRLTQVRRMMEGLAIPPSLHKMIFYLMQTYSSSSLPGANLYKISPHTFTLDTVAPYSAINSSVTLDLNNVISYMSTTTFRKTASMLTKVADQWCINEVFTPSSLSLHDLQFNTIWSNMPTIVTTISGTGARYPNAANQSTAVDFSSFVNEMDGIVWALSPIYLTTAPSGTTNIWSPSMWGNDLVSVYATTRYTNEFIYSYNSGSPKFISAPLCSNSEIIGRTRTNLIMGSAFITTYPNGSQRVVNYTAANVRDTAYQAIEWMLDIVQLFSFTKQSSNSTSNVSRTSPRSGNKRPAPKNKSKSSKGKSNSMKPMKSSYVDTAADKVTEI